MTTAESRSNNFGLIVTLDETARASGDLYWDDGISIDEELQLGSHVVYNVESNILSSSVLQSNFHFPQIVRYIEIWGLSFEVQSLLGDGNCAWRQEDAVLYIECFDIPVLSDWQLQWI